MQSRALAENFSGGRANGKKTSEKRPTEKRKKDQKLAKKNTENGTI